MDIKSIVDGLSAALTPLIAIMAVYIAFQQWRVNKSRLTHELYDRRVTVFKAVMAFYSEMMQHGTTNYQMTTKFYADTGEADFLFDYEIRKHIEDLYKRGIHLAFLYERMYPSSGEPGLPVGEERSKVAEEYSELLGWFVNELSKTKERFRKYLTVR